MDPPHGPDGLRREFPVAVDKNEVAASVAPLDPYPDQAARIDFDGRSDEIQTTMSCQRQIASRLEPSCRYAATSHTSGFAQQSTGLSICDSNTSACRRYRSPKGRLR